MNKTVLGALILIFTVSCKKNVDYSVASVKMSDYKINKVLLDSTAINGGITTSFVYSYFTTRVKGSYYSMVIIKSEIRLIFSI